MVWTAAAESTHYHPSDTKASSCSVCIVAHSANPAPTASESAPILTSVGLLREQAVTFEARLSSSRLDIRGPPAVL